MTKDQSTEERIKEAASTIFMKKGLTGARMQEIADAASINKAMLHYYFRSKQKLFEVIFAEKVDALFTAFARIFQSEGTFRDKIEQFVDLEITFISTFPSLPLFVLNEAAKNPSFVEDHMRSRKEILRKSLEKTYEQMKSEFGLDIIPLDHFMINIFSLCIYPIIARPIAKVMLDKDDEGYDAFIESRKKHVTELLLQTIKAKS